MHNKTIFAALVAVTAFGAVIAADQKPQRQSAGFLEKKDAQKGRIAIVNNQTKVAASDIEAAVKVICDQTKCNAAIGSAEGAQVVVELVDNETAPVLAAYPEDYKATVNVGKLSQGLKGDAVAKFLPGRAQRELLRAFCFACGAGGSQYPDNIMAIGKVSDLDLIKELFIPGDTAFACQSRLKNVGVTPKLIVPYARAVMEGWAPAPTNDVQKKVWQVIKERKERGPTNPIKIKPPKK